MSEEMDLEKVRAMVLENLLERVREEHVSSVHLVQGRAVCRVCNSLMSCDAIQLADEVERLQGQLTITALGQPAVEANKKLLVKNERLREALGEIADPDNSAMDDWYVKIARAALPKDETPKRKESS